MPFALSILISGPVQDVQELEPRSQAINVLFPYNSALILFPIHATEIILSIPPKSPSSWFFEQFVRKIRLKRCRLRLKSLYSEIGPGLGLAGMDYCVDILCCYYNFCRSIIYLLHEQLSVEMICLKPSQEEMSYELPTSSIQYKSKIKLEPPPNIANKCHSVLFNGVHNFLDMKWN